MELDIGRHCSVQECQQNDFLPFICDCCENVFCLDHRSYPAHECPRAGAKDHRIIHCPLCRSTIQLRDTEDPNITWERHASSNCNPSLYESRRKKKKKRCAVVGCKEVLGTSNKVQCGACRIETCLRHRFPSDHKCSSIRTSSSARGGAAASSSSMFTCKRKKRSTTTVSATTEKCPICDKKFRYVSQLVAHVEREHEESSPEVCPQCHMEFASIEALIRHAEQRHSNAISVSQGSNGSSECSIM